jgi:predicted lipid-binding transport protein (Tim44 family)
MAKSLELIFFAVVSAVVLYQLYAVLGRRIGRQPEDSLATTDRPTPDAEPVADPDPADDEPQPALTGLAAVRAKDPAFETARFLDGAKQAYEMIVIAYAAGDRATLNNLLAPSVAESFEAGMAAREAEDRTEKVEFLHPPRADLERIDVEDDVARVIVRFLAEFRSRTKGPEGEGVDDRRTAELWTFERNLNSRDPNWTLVHVDAAEA